MSPIGRGEEVSSIKYMVCVDDKYWYRIWHGQSTGNGGDYVLIHPSKHIVDKEIANKFFQSNSQRGWNCFDYLNDSTFDSDFNQLLDDRIKSKVLESIANRTHGPPLNEEIATRIQNANIVSIHSRYGDWDRSASFEYNVPHDDVLVHGQLGTVIPGLSAIAHYLRTGNVEETGYISNELYNAFPFSDVDTAESDVLSACSMSDVMERKGEIFSAMIQWFKDHGVQTLEDRKYALNEKGVDKLSEFEHLCIREYIWERKLQRVVDEHYGWGDSIQREEVDLFRTLSRKIEWNEEKQGTIRQAIQETWTECCDYIVHILLEMIEPVLTKEVLAERRLEFWKERNQRLLRDLAENEKENEGILEINE